jgi:hypothetical protein
MDNYVKKEAKKSYQRPSLRVYGAVESLTYNVGPMGTNMDGGGTVGMDKTS